MKKIWKAAGIAAMAACLMLTTAGCGGSALTDAEAKVLVNDACVDLGIMEAEAQNLVEPFAIYIDSQIDLNGTGAITMLSQSLMLAKFAFDSDIGLSQNVKYKITDTTSGSNSSVLIYSISGQTAKFQMYNYQGLADSDITTAAFAVTKTSSGYDVNYQHIYAVASSGNSGSVMVNSTVIRVEDHTPYELEINTAILSGADMAYNLSDISRITAAEKQYYNITTKKILASKSGTITDTNMEPLAGVQTLTVSETLDVTNSLLQNIKDLNAPNAQEVKTWTLTDSNFMQLLQEYLQSKNQ